MIRHLAKGEAFVKVHEDRLPLAGAQANQRIVERGREMRIGGGIGDGGRSNALEHHIAGDVLAAAIALVVAARFREDVAARLKKPPGQMRRRRHGGDFSSEQQEDGLRRIFGQVRIVQSPAAKMIHPAGVAIDEL